MALRLSGKQRSALLLKQRQRQKALSVSSSSSSLPRGNIVNPFRVLSISPLDSSPILPPSTTTITDKQTTTRTTTTATSAAINKRSRSQSVDTNERIKQRPRTTYHDAGMEWISVRNNKNNNGSNKKNKNNQKPINEPLPLYDISLDDPNGLEVIRCRRDDAVVQTLLRACPLPTMIPEAEQPIDKHTLGSFVPIRTLAHACNHYEPVPWTQNVSASSAATVIQLKRYNDPRLLLSDEQHQQCVRKIRVQLSSEQKKMVHRLCNASNVCYNRALSCGRMQDDDGGTVINQAAEEDALLDLAHRQAKQGRGKRGHKKRRQRDYRQLFRFRYNGNLDVDQEAQTLIFNDSPLLLGPMRVKHKRELARFAIYQLNKQLSSVTVQYERPGRYHLVLYYHQPVAADKLLVATTTNRHITSMDPGIKTFQTAYATDGSVVKIGPSAGSELLHYQNKMERVQLALSKIKSQPSMRRKRRSCYWRLSLLRRKIADLTGDLHRKVATYLITRHTDIMLPAFDAKNVIRKRGLTAPNVMKLKLLNHLSFVQRLLHAAPQKGVQVHLVSERYTTKTCTSCFQRNMNLRGDDVNNCPFCGFSFDRDSAGSRNIMLLNACAYIGQPVLTLNSTAPTHLF